MISRLARAAAAALCAAFLGACVDSSGEILKDAQPLFGRQLRLQFYTLHNGVADEPEDARYKWDGARYVRVSGGMSDVSAFSIHPFVRDYLIVQSVPAKRPQVVEYAVARKLAEGVYQVTAVDEDDASPSLRARLCRRADDSHCRIETRAALLQFARATARHRKGQGGLVLRLADDVSGPSP